MRKQRKRYESHREGYDLPNGKFNDEVLIDWYTKCQPGGSGPISLMRMFCAVIEELAELKGIKLPNAQYTRTIDG